jgi:hypothetical protein
VNRFRTLLWLAIGAVALSSCTLIPTSAKPVSIPPSQGLSGLLGRTIPGTNHGRVRFVTQPVYIVDATGHLSSLSRIVTAPASLTSVLDQVIVGPTKIEKFAGYASDLPSNLLVLQATVKDKVAYIDISESLAKRSRTKEILAIGQLVFTAYYAGAKNGIEISVAGIAQKLLLPDHKFVSIATAKDCEILLQP